MMHLVLLAALAAYGVVAVPIQAEHDLGNIVFASVLFRHGDRTPTSSYPNDPYNDEAKYWPRGYGQLTEIGEEQHYRLGSYLRQRYSDLLPLTYNTNDTYIRSTDVDRTLVSARCNLEGLYPPTERTLSQPSIRFQAIPIHTETSSNDHLLMPTLSCAKYKTMLSYLKDSYEYQCVMNETAHIQEEVAAFAGYSSFSSKIYRTLFIEELYNLTLPDWVWPYYPNPLKSLFLLENFIVEAGTPELQRLSAGPMLKEITENMKAKANATLSPDRKLYIYSAHDKNLVDTQQALNVFNGNLVPYASALKFELHKCNGSYYVAVSYKNSTETEPYLLQLPGCDSLCPLDQFVELTKEVIPDDLDTECAEEVTAGTEYLFQVPAAAILPEWEHCFQKPKSDDGLFHFLSVKTSSK
ncbi:prostatic acid phosphatase-like [Bacillus rossius redtenbacheri]|uniref:prostatic acid phosphatase-like n=1 Tax=Bacillus rossius redtenbacheri TaxID=93214 RepID=UPI002FDCCDE1